MLKTEYKQGLFTIQEIWFSEYPYEVKGCDVVIFRECPFKIDVKGFECREFNTIILDLTKSLESIWNEFSKKSCKYEIKRAERDGVVIKNAWLSSHMYRDYCDFYKLNKQFRRLKKLNGVMDLMYMYRNCTLFVAEVNGDMIAGQLYLEDMYNMRWLLGASKRLEFNNHLIGCANRALIWEAIKYAKHKGIEIFDFGGHYEGNNQDLTAISFFKESFGGDVVTRYIYQKNYSKLYNLLSSFKRKL